MRIKNVLTFTEEKTFLLGNLQIKDGRFVSEECSNDEDIIDGDGLYAIPGLIDLHFHGCMGHDFCDGSTEAIEVIAKYQASVGVTSICPATMTLPEETLAQVMRSAASYNADANHPDSAGLVGINMEGPFISAQKKGAQAADYILPCDLDFFHRLQQLSGGLIKLVDIAPEGDGAMEFIQAAKDEVGISLAHTMADYDTALMAYQKGARHATHLYNAMPPFTHRAPGVIGAACDSPHVMAELICDGVHIHPSVVRATFQMFGDDRVILISDSMRAAGMPDGHYTLGGQDVTVSGKHATLDSDGALAGSVTNLMDCLRTAVKDMNIPLESAVACATINPARALKIDKDYGSITAGKVANLVLMDKDLNIKKIIING